MNLDDEYTDWHGTKKTIRNLFDDLDRRLAELHHVMLVPGALPSRIPGDQNRTNGIDALMDVTAKVLGPSSQPPPAPWPEPIPDNPPEPDPTPPAPRPDQPGQQQKPAPAPDRSWAPARNVTAAGLAGAAGTVAAWIADLYGVTLPEPVSAAGVLLLTAVTAWLVPSAQRGQQR